MNDRRRLTACGGSSFRGPPLEDEVILGGRGYAEVVPAIRDEAIVVRRWDWSETSQAALLFCREHGAVRGLAKGAKREKSSFSGGLEPLTRGEVGAIVKPNSELATLTDWNLTEIFPGVRATARGFLISHYIADLIRQGVRDSDPHPALWDATIRALRALVDRESAELALLHFQWALLQETGYRPDATALAKRTDALSRPDGAWVYDPQRGVVISAGERTDGDDVWAMRTDTAALVLALARGDTPVAGPETIERANRFLAACARWAFGEPLPTMERLFGTSLFGGSSRPTSAPER